MNRKILIIIVVSLFDIGFYISFIDGEALLFSAASFSLSFDLHLTLLSTL